MTLNFTVEKKFISRGFALIEDAETKKLTSESFYIKGDPTNYIENIRGVSSNFQSIQLINISNTSCSIQKNILLDGDTMYFTRENTDPVFSKFDKFLLKNGEDSEPIMCYVINITSTRIYITAYSNITGIYTIKNIIKYEPLSEINYTYNISTGNITSDLKIIPLFLPKITLQANRSSNKQFLINIKKETNDFTIFLIPNPGEFINGDEKFSIDYVSDKKDKNYTLILIFDGENNWSML